MAVVAVSNSNNRAEDMEGTPTVTDIGAGAGGAKETVTYFQGAASISRKVTNSGLRGTGTTLGATVDMTTGDDTTWLSKTLLTDYLAVNSVGWLIRAGSSTSAYYDYILIDDGTLGDRSSADFPRGGWIVEAVNPNVAAWRDAAGTAPTLTAMQVFQVGAGMATGAAKAENIFIDSVDFGDGLYLVGGDSTDPDGRWRDFVAADQGSATTGRIGHFLTNASGIEVRGKAIRGRTSAGTVTATVFTDSLQSVTWPGGRVAAGWNELEDDLGNASTVITETNTTFAGLGRDNTKKFFDTENEVTGGATDTITITDGHGYATGEYVTYSNEGGTETPGITNGTSYWVRAVSTTDLAFYTTRANAYSDTTRVGLTASSAGNGENHSLVRTPDTRPDYTATSTSGSADYNGCNFIRFKDLTLTSGVTLNGCNIVSANSITPGGGSITSCVVTGGTTYPGVALVSGTVTQLEAITDTSFTASTNGGHALEATGTVSALDISGLVFTGYGPDPEAGDGHSFNTETDVDGVNEEIDYTSHQFATGDPVYYSNRDPSTGTAGTEAIGLTDATLYYVRSVTANSFSLHPTKYAADNNVNKVGLTASAGGSGEVHTFYSANAAIVNNTGGAMTINVAGGGSTPTVRNVGASTSTVINAVTLTVTVVDTGGSPISGARVAIFRTDNDLQLMNELTTGSGIASESFAYASDTAIYIRARHASGSPAYLDVETTGTITSSGFTVTITMQVDTTIN